MVGINTESLCWLVKPAWEIINLSVTKCSVYGKKNGLILAGNGNVMSLNGNKNWELHSCKLEILMRKKRASSDKPQILFVLTVHDGKSRHVY